MNFDENIALELGVECAILLSNIQFWVKKNRANGEEKHFHDGRWWTYNSAGSFAKLFPYWKERSVYNYLEKLEKAGYIMSGNYNQFKYDRTKWYTTDGCKNSVYKVMEIQPPKDVTPSAKFANASTEICGPIPDITTDKKPDINSYVSSPAKAVETSPPNKLSKEEMDIIFKFRGLFCPAESLPKLYAMEKRSGSARKLLEAYSFDEVVKVMERAKDLVGRKYEPQVSSWPSLVTKFEAVKATIPKGMITNPPTKLVTGNAELDSY